MDSRVRFGVGKNSSGMPLRNTKMRRSLASAVLFGLALSMPAWAFAQTAPMPVIPALKPVHPGRTSAKAPLWQHDGNDVSVIASGHANDTVPSTTETLDGQTRSAKVGVQLTTKPGITAHVNVDETRWGPLVPACAPGTNGCMGIAPVDGVQRGEVGAGYAGHGVKLDLSIGQAQSEPGVVRARNAPLLPRVLPAEGGADVAAPLWFRNSTSTSLNARGQVSLATGTRLDLGASVGRVKFLPGSGAAADDALAQTTLSLGVQHGVVRGAIVGHMLEPDMSGTTVLGQNQRWSGIDLGISVRLPWRGELNFGAQNVWSSGRTPLLFGPGGTVPDQGRVPYVQYHQTL